MAERERGIVQIEATGLQSLSQMSNLVTGLNQGLELTGKLMGIVTQATKQFVQTGSQFEQYGLQLQTMLGSVDKAQTRLKELFDFASTTPFEISGVVEAGQILEAYGRYSEDALRAVGDAAAAMGKDFKETALALAGVSTGEMERLKQLGITTADVTAQLGHEMVRDTKEGLAEISDAVVELFEQKFGGGMARMRTSMSGMISELSDSWTKFMKMVADSGPFQTVKDILGSVLETVNQLFDQGKAEKTAELVGKALSDALWDVTIALADVAAEVYELVGRASKVYDFLFGKGPGTSSRSNEPTTEWERQAIEQRKADNDLYRLAMDLRASRSRRGGDQPGTPTNPSYVPGGWQGPYWPGAGGQGAAAGRAQEYGPFGGAFGEFVGPHEGWMSGGGMGRGDMNLGARGEVEPMEALMGFSSEDFVEDFEYATKSAQEMWLDTNQSMVGHALEGWEAYYSRIGDLGAKWVKGEKASYKDVGNAAKAGAVAVFESWMQEKTAKWKLAAAEQVALALGALFSNPAKAAAHFASAAKYGALIGAAGIAAGAAQQWAAGSEGGGRESAASGSSGEATGTRTVSRTVGVTTQSITNNVYVNHYAPVAYAPGGWRQVIDQEIIPAIEEAFEFARVG